jgi:hypothetical protein
MSKLQWPCPSVPRSGTSWGGRGRLCCLEPRAPGDVWIKLINELLNNGFASPMISSHPHALLEDTGHIKACGFHSWDE